MQSGLSLLRDGVRLCPPSLCVRWCSRICILIIKHRRVSWLWIWHYTFILWALTDCLLCARKRSRFIKRKQITVLPLSFTWMNEKPCLLYLHSLCECVCVLECAYVWVYVYECVCDCICACVSVCVTRCVLLSRCGKSVSTCIFACFSRPIITDFCLLQ